ncbi:arabinoxylan arabinofuranohydrolase [Paenibacillus sp. CAA11]|uniref:glycoside hydrolase family 43 protein n=1 Tax=Paenibacillus sp. CAA11 TaxID=1532905 RepID=UPI000D3BBE72|nr:glycoside hydrolase family 43 protein [Paenibacillus sp. CAA11]AWB44676.1 arabinoxylan arabinofuranohydrolase [Paenibacillus sp. CAA11]
MTNEVIHSPIGKVPPNGNPLVSHRFGADPYVLVFKNRVYVFNTDDVLEYDEHGGIKDNSYSTINRISVLSSDDLVNWTDHGVIPVAGSEGIAKWATQSWAPAAVHKCIGGKDQFFLYFANNASSIGVLKSDNPTGPWVDPIGKPLITRDTAGVEGVVWLFDPAVLVDDDGQAYIYFGGGLREGQHEQPDTARVMRLGEDMISVTGEARIIPAPFMFEDSGIHKTEGIYYYTYCSNFYTGSRSDGSPPAGEIAYMTSDNPMGPWTYKGTILKNPGHFFGVSGNNHHAIFQFQNAWYIAYHAQTLSKAMGTSKGYRSTHINRINYDEDGFIKEVAADLKGVEQIKPLNPFIRTEAGTLAWSAGISVQMLQESVSLQTGASRMILTDIHHGDWIAVSGVDFGNGAASFSASMLNNGEGVGWIELHLDTVNGRLIGMLEVPITYGKWKTIATNISDASGIHDLYLLFKGASKQPLFQIESWQFKSSIS